MIQIYTGEGKGKTTAAMGLALRAIGANKRVAILQFMKKGDSSEIKAIKKYHLPINVFSFGIGFYHILNDKHSDKEHRVAAEKGLKKASDIIASKKYDLIILDEIIVAADLKLIDVDNVVAILPNDHSKKFDIILTGRNAHPKLKKIADLVSEIKPVKHYFDNDISARKGIEF